MKIFLIRHGESQSNCDSKLHQIMPDHEISLSSRGVKQAEFAGELLKKHFEKEYNDLSNKNNSEKSKKELQDKISNLLGKNNKLTPAFEKLFKQINLDNILSNNIQQKIKLYHSPYRRTRETTNEIIKNIKPLLSEIKEDVLLAEEVHGIFDGLEDDEQEKLFPEEYKLFKKTSKHNGKFWAKYSQGESPFDVSVRLRQFFSLLKEDEENGISDVIIICHGIVIKVFTMAYLNKTPEWYEEEKSPGNCAIRILENNKDLGYIYGGHRDGNEWTYRGNKS